MIAVQCKDITKYYGEGENRFKALKDVNLELTAGEITILAGPSGSGKTTLLSVMHTILTPDEGDLFILGHHINNMNEEEKAHFRSQNIGAIFQALYLIPTLTVLENVSLPLVIQGVHDGKAKAQGKDILKQVALSEKMNSSPTELSRGQQQRVAIARALITKPKIIMCDEPTSALDEKAGLEFMSILRDYALHHSQTVFVVTHDSRIFPFANRIININDGIIETKK